jgi:ubiquinone/menaquinone biosynthesis C-methylase UbiE
MSERSFDDFDEFAADYRDIHTQNIKLSGADSFYFAEMKVRLLQEFETNQSLKVLDIGCGDGATEVFMQQYFPSWRIQAIDISERSIETAEKRKLSNTSFTVFDGKHIPFEDDSFDLVFMAGVLHHVAFRLHDYLIREISRVLKKDGRLYLYEHNPLNPFTKYLVKTCVFDKDAKLLRHGYASKLLTKNNLAVKNKNFTIFFPRKGILSKLIFLEKYLQWLPLGGQYFIRAGKP